MANTEQNLEQEQDQLEVVENSIGRTEMFIDDNKEKLLTIVGIIVLIGVGIWAYFNYYKTPREEKASSQMYQAELLLQSDSVSRALNGDANFPGFLTIIDQYSGTKAANNAKYYAGACYMKLGEFDKAIDMLDGFSTSDPVLGAMSTGLIGDAYMEKGDTDKAIKYYEKATDKAKGNTFAAPLYMQKLAVAYEKLQKFKDALAVYEQIKAKFPSSTEGRDAEKFIKAMKLKLGE